MTTKRDPGHHLRVIGLSIPSLKGRKLTQILDGLSTKTIQAFPWRVGTTIFMVLLEPETVSEVTWVIPRLPGYGFSFRVRHGLPANMCSLTPFFGCIIGKWGSIFVVLQILTSRNSNIDRIFAIYQALYPDKWVPTSGRLNATTKLYPFRKNANDFWSSNEVKDWRTLGYATPGNELLNKESTAKLETYLHEYYNW